MKWNYIHIPKTAGSSFKKYNKDQGLKNVTVHGHHITADDKENVIITVRNPIDRFISSFHFFLRNKTKQNMPVGIKTPNDLLVKLWQDDEETTNWIRPISQQVGGIKYTVTYAFMPQYVYFGDEKNIKMVIDFDQMDDHFEQMCKITGNDFTSLAHVNKSRRKSTDEYEFSDIAMEQLHNMYGKDFALHDKYSGKNSVLV